MLNRPLSEEEIAAKVAEFEQSQRNYSDIDLIYEKNALAKKKSSMKEEAKDLEDDLLMDDQIDSIFSSLIEEEE